MSTVRDESHHELEAAILRAIDDRPPVHLIDLADAVDEDPIAVERACTQLDEDGYLRPAPQGLYTLTDAGRRRLADRR
ncbi:winged helix DNA-binding protein [Halorubrum sp. SD683]|uniref:winged helix DNA-binding protein n=1 Tax=Halorubrum sp. SD683 TaxID=1855873 RepID=UPI00117AA7E8|nr:winged helix DNA-binding protein [Halorubrum sp. SD683]